MLRERPDRVFFGSSDTLVFKTKQYLRKFLFWWEGNFIVRFSNIATLSDFYLLKKCQGNLSLKIKKRDKSFLLCRKREKEAKVKER